MDATGPPSVRGVPWPDLEALASVGVQVVRPEAGAAEAMVALQSDPALWVDVPPAWRMASLEEQQAELASFVAHWDAHGFGYWLVRDATSGALLGVAGLRWLRWRDAWALNVLVRLAVGAQGRGIATVALDHAITRLGEGLGERTTVVVRTRPRNAPMVALAHRLGFVDVGTEEREMGTYRVLVREVGGRAPRS